VDDDWKLLVNRIRSHIITIESQAKSLEEDKSIDENPHLLNSDTKDIEEPLREYIG